MELQNGDPQKATVIQDIYNIEEFNTFYLPLNEEEEKIFGALQKRKAFNTAGFRLVKVRGEVVPFFVLAYSGGEIADLNTVNDWRDLCKDHVLTTRGFVKKAGC